LQRRQHVACASHQIPVRASFRSLSCCGLAPACVGSGAGFGGSSGCCRRFRAATSGAHCGALGRGPEDLLTIIRYPPRCPRRVFDSFPLLTESAFLFSLVLFLEEAAGPTNGRRIVLLFRFRRSVLCGQEGPANHSSGPEGLSSSFLRPRLRTCCVVPVDDSVLLGALPPLPGPLSRFGISPVPALVARSAAPVPNQQPSHDTIHGRRRLAHDPPPYWNHPPMLTVSLLRGFAHAD
jgi:hypothetical protein